MKLNIYNKKEIIKTYETEKYDIMFGTVEDIAKAINLEKMQTGSDVEIIKMVSELVLTSMDTIKGLIVDIFDGITEEELKSAKVSEIALVLIDVVKLTIEQLNTLQTKQKN